MLHLLPDNVWGQIYGYFSYYEDLLALSSINNRLRCLAMEYVEKVAFNGKNIDPDTDGIRKILQLIFSRFPRTRKLYLYSTGSAVSFACDSCYLVYNEVESLKLAGLVTDGTSLHTIRLLFPNLTHLDLDECSYFVGYHDKIPSHFAQLTSFRLPKHTRIRHEHEREFADQITESLPELSSFNFTSCMSETFIEPFLAKYRYTLRSLWIILRTWDLNRDEGKLSYLGQILNGHLPNLQNLQATFMYISCFKVEALNRILDEVSPNNFSLEKILVTLEGFYPLNFSQVLNIMQSRSRQFEVKYNANMCTFLNPYVQCAENLTWLTLSCLERLNVCSVLIRCRNLVYADFHLNKDVKFEHACQIAGPDSQGTPCWSNKLQYVSLYVKEQNREVILDFFSQCTLLGDGNADAVFLAPKDKQLYATVVTKSTFHWMTQDAMTFDQIKDLHTFLKTPQDFDYFAIDEKVNPTFAQRIGKMLRFKNPKT